LSIVDNNKSIEGPKNEEYSSTSSHSKYEHQDYLLKMKSHQEGTSYTTTSTSQHPQATAQNLAKQKSIHNGNDYQTFTVKDEDGDKNSIKVERKAAWLLSGILGKSEEEEESTDEEVEQDLERKSTRQSSKSSKSAGRKSSPEVRRWEERYQ
jgi:hypothetical protein